VVFEQAGSDYFFSFKNSQHRQGTTPCMLSPECKYFYFPLERNKIANYQSDYINLFIIVIEFGGHLFSLCFKFSRYTHIHHSKGRILELILGPFIFPMFATVL
jgi:hypothetical protein